MDPDSHLAWEIDFPTSPEDFIPFLGTEIRIKDDNLEYKYYRKTQKKEITLHSRSHHPLRTKVEVIKNFYKTAGDSSSNSQLVEESYQIVDRLLLNNGYTNPRQYIDYRSPSHCGPKREADSSRIVTLKLPYISETISEQISKYVSNKKLPIRIVFLPGIKLRDLFCSSRPHDRRVCSQSNCQICPKITTERTDCSKMYPLYKITCKLCNKFYVGESSRSLHHRLSEHLRYATKPDNASYKNEAMAVHYKDHHAGQEPDLAFELLGTESNTILRKIYEAQLILSLKPEINDREECVLLQRFLVS